MHNESKSRSSNYKKQVQWSFLFKLLSVGCSFLVIPLMIAYLGKEEYGVWSTLLSVSSWIILFDVGIGNGLRNKISESLAEQDLEKTKAYISTAYMVIVVIVTFLLLCTFLSSYFIPWQKIFNTRIFSEDYLRNVVNITLLFMLINFWLNLIDQVFNGFQRTSLSVLNQFLKNATILIFVFLLDLFAESSLISLAIIYGSATILVNVLISIWFYKKNKNIQPDIKKYSKDYIKPIASLGVNFFLIQIAVIVLFTTDKILITQLFGSAQVADYDVVFRLFSMVTVIHTILMAPLWSAYSDAFHRKDFLWMEKTLKQQLKLFVLFVGGIIILAVLTRPIVKIWIGNGIELSTSLILSVGLFVTISIWNNIFAYFMNATNQLKTQMITSVFAVFINIPLSIFFVKQFDMGVYSIVLGTVVALSLFAVFGSLQVFKSLKKWKKEK